MRTEENALESHGRLLARLVRGLLAREPFETLADVTEALKVECARLRIRYSPDDIGDAFRLIASNHPIVTPAPPLERLERPEPPAVGRREAAAILAGLGVRSPRTMPALRRLTADELERRDWRTDKRKAYALIEALILETAARADALEAALETDHEAAP
jgi:hypothetical protein